MGLAYKCDRCGALYTKSTALNKHELRLMKVPNVGAGMDYCPDRIVFDLCVECLEDLYLFTQGQPVKKPGDKS